MVAEGDRLRALQVGVSRHHGIGFLLCQGYQRLHVLEQQRPGGFRFGAQVQAQVRGDLVVARTPGMHFLADLADAFHQGRLDVHVHVFQFLPPGEFSRFDIGHNGVQPAADPSGFILRQHADARQHLHVGDGPLDIIRRQAPVERHGFGKLLHEPIRSLGKTAAPGFGCVFFGCHRQD